ncbi:polyamine ABC transporter substrate-binding protein [Chromobacterium phragmitis]|uniref:Putrescine-binding periplasmic protein n=1 Tax=Chromobacterium phragmitis TaxID=2202141 RepID=A0A344UC32_9NEIS|nr:polyamine ABC transporter substrate-binding protein [Chromobacterium phragmitis]AXE31425.1 polyamine ABC transporter substrate-binding protein [Chromobacterium phragmitis]AXE32830.1 polyamine ABC transporter substrate-binding protein [Chromobacterium phragmitis]AXE36808.1 polyamine ABC transporter substrate-binding protein [Chromobacterium phragmitis]
MKKKLVRKALCSLLLLLPATGALAAGKVLNVYNWSDYIAKSTIPGFEKQSGVKVKYDVYDSDDTLQAKMLTGHSGYDIVVPTSNFMAKQIEAGIYQKLDKSKLPNLANLDKTLMAKIADADPGNAHGVPWAYGTDGFGYNLTKVKAALGDKAPLESWEMLFNPQYLSKLKGCGVSVLDQPSDVFAAALHYLGKDPNSKNPADYQAAFNMMKKIRPYITQFNSSGYINDLANGDICFAYGFSGDVHIAKRRAAEAKRPYQIAYVLPKGGAPVWFDVMVIPKDAPHPEEAHKWINYVSLPEVNAEITNTVFYPTVNVAARKYVKPEIANDPTVYPPESVMKSLFLLKPLPPEIMRVQNRLWTQLKTGH